MICVSRKFLLFLFTYVNYGFVEINSYLKLWYSDCYEIFMVGYWCHVCAVVKNLGLLVHV